MAKTTVRFSASGYGSETRKFNTADEARRHVERDAAEIAADHWNKRVRPFCICFTVYAWRNVAGLRGRMRGT